MYSACMNPVGAVYQKMPPHVSGSLGSYAELSCVPFFTPAAIPGLFVGCLIANVLGGGIILDVGCTAFRTFAVCGGWGDHEQHHRCQNH